MSYFIILISLVISIITSISIYFDSDKEENTAKRLAGMCTCFVCVCIIFILCFVFFTMTFAFVKNVLGVI